jgi:hypothetical protein
MPSRRGEKKKKNHFPPYERISKIKDRKYPLAYMLITTVCYVVENASASAL